MIPVTPDHIQPLASGLKSSTGEISNVDKVSCTSSANLRGFLLTAQGQSATPLWEMALLISPLLWGVRVFVQGGTRNQFHEVSQKLI